MKKLGPLPAGLVFDPSRVARAAAPSTASPVGVPVAAAPAPASYNLDPNARFELWERDLRVVDPAALSWELPVATTNREWGGVDVYIPELSMTSGQILALQVSVYAIAFGRRVQVGSGFFHPGAGSYVPRGSQLVASVRGLSARWEVVIGASGDGVNPVEGQVKCVVVAHDAITTPVEGAGVAPAFQVFPFLSRPSRAYAVRSVVPASAVALMLFDSVGVPINGATPAWSAAVGPVGTMVSLTPPEWGQLFMRWPMLVWSQNTTVALNVAPVNDREVTLR